MANYIIKNGELYHARRLSNMSASSKRKPTYTPNQIKPYLINHIKRTFGLSNVKDYTLSNVVIKSDEWVTFTMNFTKERAKIAKTTSHTSKVSVSYLREMYGF